MMNVPCKIVKYSKKMDKFNHHQYDKKNQKNPPLTVSSVLDHQSI